MPIQAVSVIGEVGLLCFLLAGSFFSRLFFIFTLPIKQLDTRREMQQGALHFYLGISRMVTTTLNPILHNVCRDSLPY
jgi:hypothetical protein